MWGEYEGRECNGGKKDHYCSGDCSRNIVDSTVDAVHSEDKGEDGCMRVKDTSLSTSAQLITNTSPEFWRSGRSSRKGINSRASIERRGRGTPV